MTATTVRLCDACKIGGHETPATHYETRERRFAFCDVHSAPWDVPLQGAAQAAEKREQSNPSGWPGERLEGLGY